MNFPVGKRCVYTMAGGEGKIILAIARVLRTAPIVNLPTNHDIHGCRCQYSFRRATCGFVPCGPQDT